MSRMRAVPGHDGTLPVAATDWGGARGCLHRAKISMTIIRPPQQGQGGSGSIDSGASTGNGGGATASSSRARAMLVLHAELASKP